MENTGKRIGIFICTGCSIGERLDTGKLSGICTGEAGVICVKLHPFLCHETTRKEISEAIGENNLDAMVIGACSPRVKTSEFTFDSIRTERVNLREQVVWCHRGREEEIQALAEDYIRMAVAKVNTTGIPLPVTNPGLNTDILVIGGGITGITAALESAMAGYAVYLVEKMQQLGGRSATLYKQVPSAPPYDRLVDPQVRNKIREVTDHPGIHVFLSGEVLRISGQPGQFEVLLSENGEEKTIRAAAIILATGWKPYDAGRLQQYGYGVFTNVITSIELEGLVTGSPILRPSDNQPARRILFIQCAGSRDPEHLPYCSTVCCTTSLKQATYFRSLNPGAQVYIIYKDIRAFGMAEYFYKEVQKDNHIFMTKGVVSKLVASGDDLVAEVEESLVGDVFQIQADLVVLATGMVPNDPDDLNLSYRLGKGLPPLKYNFPDSHFICFPYETRRTGIYAAGTIRAPGSVQMCIEDAAGAAMKAIQCIELTRRGEAVHPRAGDRSFPELYMPRCTDCKRCTEECPFGSFDETEKGTPLTNTNRCRRCGICMGSCPERIISFQDYSIHSVSSMIKAVSMPDEFEKKPRILAFVCENDAYPAFDMAGLERMEYDASLRIIPVRCIGSVNKVWISDALSKGFDGIMLIGCKPGDDYQCHYIVGSELIETRGENIQEALQTMMLEPERLRTVFLEINEYPRIPEIISGYRKEIEAIGPNPFKGL